jgi:small-conductance mechanosensitive channel
MGVVIHGMETHSVQTDLIGLACLLAGAVVHILLKGASRPSKADRRTWWRRSGRVIITSTIAMSIIYVVACLAGFGANRFIMILQVSAPTLEVPAYIGLLFIGYANQGIVKHLLSIAERVTAGISGKAKDDR